MELSIRSTSLKTQLQPQDDSPDPRSGDTTGVTGILWAAIDTGPLKKRMDRAFTINSQEGKFNAIVDYISLPLKVTISIISGLKTLVTYATGPLSQTFIKIGMGTALVCLTPIFIIESIAFLAIEMIRTFVGLIKSFTFESKEQIHTVLSTLQSLTITEDRTIDDVLSYMKDHSKILIKLIGEEVLHDFMRARNNPKKQLLQIRALITQKKVAAIYHTYITEGSEKDRDYLSRRIGHTTVIALRDYAQNIDEDTPYVLSFQETRSLEKFTEKGFNLLSLMDQRRRKVLAIHSYSIGVLAIAFLSLSLSSALLPTTLPVIITATSTLAILSSLGRSFANDAFLENTKKGVDMRLAVPKFLIPKEGEEHFSIWHTSNKVQKAAYLFFSVISGGLLPLFDGCFYKCLWVKNLRGSGDQFNAVERNALIIPDLTHEE